MKKNPYDVLGVDKKAKSDAIKRAYHRKAKKAHPDGGGSADAFSDLTFAFRLLTDESRRRKFDATGEAAEAQPDQSLSAAYGLICENLFACFERIPEGRTADLMEMIRQNFRGALGKANEARRDHLKKKSKFERLLKRFKGGKVADVLNKAVEDKISEIDAMISNVYMDEKPIRMALDMLNGVTFDVGTTDVGTAFQQLQRSFDEAMRTQMGGFGR